MSTIQLARRLSQTQTLTPRLQHAVRLLQMSSLDYAQELNEAMARNPFLEPDDDGGDGLPTGDPSRSPALQGAADTAMSAIAGDPTGAVDVGRETDAAHADGARENDADDWPRAADADDCWPRGTGAPTGETEATALDFAATHVGLREHLLFQANVLRLGERDRALLCAAIECLDDDGYLRTSLDDVARLAELDPAADATETTTALRLLQSFEPAGVGATSLRECLQLQWRQLPMDDADRELGEHILTEQLEVLARRDAIDLARRCHCDPTTVDRLCHAIRRLDPRPGLAYANEQARYITPDVIVRKARGQWSAQLNPAAVPRIRLNQRYAHLFQRHRDARHREMAGHLQEARWTLRNIEQRFSTILDVSNAILRRQHRFLDVGVFAMKPLMLREIASDCGLHQSTVCRVTNNKYMATPCGVFELKYFFSRAMPMKSGGACSPTAIRGLIEGMVANEPPDAPLSDVDIARLLARQGVQVARRTVTKYRQMLKLPAVERRRQLAQN